MEEYNNLKNWLTSSGLMVLTKSDPNVGGVHSFYDVQKNSYGFLYPEITGYNLSLMRFLYEQEKSNEFLEIGKLSASWLIDLFEKEGYIIMGVNADPKKSKLAFSFDTGICAKGLMDIYECTKIEKYRDYARELIKQVETKFLEEDGTIRPVFDLSTGKFFEDSSLWYMQKGCLHIKLAIPFLQLSSMNQNYVEIARKICDTIKNYQNDDGSISIHQGSKIVNLHTHCYVLEGLMYAFSELQENQYLESCRRGIEWALSKIEKDSSIQLWFNSSEKSKACYPIAQMIRLTILLDSLDNKQNHKESIAKLVQFLLSLQALEHDPKITGGLYEEYYKSFTGWKKRPKLNSWGSMFGLQALYWWHHYGEINFKESIKLLF